MQELLIYQIEMIRFLTHKWRTSVYLQKKI